VISKDADFYNSFLRKSEPYKVIFLTVGNMSTDEIIKLFEKNILVIIEQISQNFVLEISAENIITII
jgi:predicted nuclease of predicted toxin-antitoxin system